MRFYIAAIAVSTMAMAGAAQAQDSEHTGVYVAARIGAASMNDPVVTYYDAGGTFGGTGTQDTAVGTVKTKSAVTFGGTIGYDFGMIRADVEVDYAKHDIESLTINSLNGTAVTLTAADRADVCAYLETTTCGGSGNTFTIDGSRLRSLSAMGNLWLDIPVGDMITPYVGGGVGIAGFELDGEGKGKFAWQLGAGVAVNLSDAVALTVDYRHRQVDKPAVEYDASSGFTLDKLKTDSVTAGVRFSF